VPLSEHEQRVLQELEHALQQDDPAFADRVRAKTVYRYAARNLKWSLAAFVAGLVVMVVFFTREIALGFVGFLIMFASLVWFWANLRRMGKAGIEDIGKTLRADNIGNAIQDTKSRIKGRFRKED
jgi:hypothetical protein